MNDSSELVDGVVGLCAALRAARREIESLARDADGAAGAGGPLVDVLLGVVALAARFDGVVDGWAVADAASAPPPGTASAMRELLR